MKSADEKGVEEGAFLLGPLARPFVMWLNWGPVLLESAFVVDVLTLAVRCVTGLLDRELSLAADGGPRASKPARPGLNRPASLLPIASLA